MPDFSLITGREQPPYYWSRQGISLEEVEQKIRELLAMAGLALSVGGTITPIVPDVAGVTSVNGRSGAVTLTKSDLGLGSVDNTADSAKPVSTAMITALNAKQNTSDRGIANGYADLDATGKLPAAKLPTLTIAMLPPGVTLTVRKDPTTGFWPSGWTNDVPSYAGGSASAGVRPTSRADLFVIWKGPDPSPAIVTTGAGGMRDNLDMRAIT